MDFLMLGRKRLLFDGHEAEPRFSKRKCFTDWSGRALQHDGLKSGFFWNLPNERPRRVNGGCHGTCVSQTWLNTRTKYLTDTARLFEQTLLWSDTQNSAKKVLEHLLSKRDIGDFLLCDHVSSKFSAFRRDFREECGIEDKQHSWAVIEKREEVIMYGPYYPNYSNGEHSEDIIIQQTQELLCSGDVPEDWRVYVFTMNSPCLARNTDPCMLTLIQKAWEWWSMYGVKTHIGFMRCWGFKGNKENLFKDLSYKQVEYITQSVDYESYVQVANKIANLNPLCETVFTFTKEVLRSDKENFPMITNEQKQDRKNYFKSVSNMFEHKQEDEKKLLTKEMSEMVEAAEVLLVERAESLEEHLRRGQSFSLGYTFSPQVCDVFQDEVRVKFQQCWRETVQDRYAEFVREKLTDKFNQYAVQLFLKDILKFTQEYLQIGKLNAKLFAS